MALPQGLRALCRRLMSLPKAAIFLRAALAFPLLTLALATGVLADSPPGTIGAATTQSATTSAPADRLDQIDPASRGGTRSPDQSLAGLDSKAAFIETAASAAQASQAETGVPASVTIAQAILESDWGRSTVSGANNYFGIKATSGPGPAGVVWAETQEFIGGAWQTIQAPFRAYHSMAESFLDHGRFLAENQRYARAFDFKDDARMFAQIIQQAGYATDPSYAQKLIGLMDKYDLYRFDLPPRSAPNGGSGQPRAI